MGTTIKADEIKIMGTASASWRATRDGLEYLAWVGNRRSSGEPGREGWDWTLGVSDGTPEGSLSVGSTDEDLTGDTISGPADQDPLRALAALASFYSAWQDALSCGLDSENSDLFPTRADFFGPVAWEFAMDMDDSFVNKNL